MEDLNNLILRLFKATVIKKCGPELNQYINGQLIFSISAKALVDKGFFSTNNAATIRYPHAKKMNFNPYFSMYMKINSKWITDLNRKSKTIKLLEKKM